MTVRYPFPTTPKEAHHAARSQERRVAWADRTADELRARWSANAEAYWNNRDQREG